MHPPAVYHNMVIHASHLWLKERSREGRVSLNAMQVTKACHGLCRASVALIERGGSQEGSGLIPAARPGGDPAPPRPELYPKPSQFRSRPPSAEAARSTIAPTGAPAHTALRRSGSGAGLQGGAPRSTFGGAGNPESAVPWNVGSGFQGEAPRGGPSGAPEWPPPNPNPRSNLAPARSASPSAGGSTRAMLGLAPARSLPSAGSIMAGRELVLPARSASSASSLLSPYPARGTSGKQACRAGCSREKGRLLPCHHPV